MNESEIQRLEFEVNGMMSDVEFNPTLMELSLGFRSLARTSGYRQVLPEEKAVKVKEVQLQDKKLPWLVMALMMHLHLLVASEAADVTILGGELLLIPKAIGIRKGT